MDYMIEYPIVVNFLSKELGLPKDTFTTLSIKELPDVMMANIACPKNDWGTKVVIDLNRAIEANLKTPEYRNQMLKWYAIPREKALIDKAAQKSDQRPPIR